jgi:hypothetical protein
VLLEPVDLSLEAGRRLRDLSDNNRVIHCCSGGGKVEVGVLSVVIGEREVLHPVEASRSCLKEEEISLASREEGRKRLTPPSSGRSVSPATGS